MSEAEMKRGFWARYVPGDRGPLDFVTKHVFWLGLVAGVVFWRRTYAWWPFFIPLFIAEVFSRGTPDMARAVLIAPFYFLFVGIAIDEGLKRIRRTDLRVAAMAGCAALAAVVMTTQVQDYFSWQEKQTTQASRLPGVAVCEWPAWRAIALDAVHEGRLVARADLDKMRAAIDCSPVIRANERDRADLEQQ
jgi:hypothetical protein